MIPTHIFHTDGACSGNPGPGGWGVYGGPTTEDPKSFNGGQQETTNNQMELSAAIFALGMAPEKSVVQIYSDSKYVIDGAKSWLKNWKKRNWRTAKGDAVKNKELWQSLDKLQAGRTVIWTWVKGHADNEGNIIADQLAVWARDEAARGGKNATGLVEAIAAAEVNQ